MATPENIANLWDDNTTKEDIFQGIINGIDFVMDEVSDLVRIPHYSDEVRLSEMKDVALSVQALLNKVNNTKEDIEFRKKLKGLQ